MQHNRKHALRSKGQNIVEYALMLAIIVGIGFLIYSQNNFGQKIQAVFGNANNLLATVDEDRQKQAARAHDREYGNQLAQMLKDAIDSGTIIVPNGSFAALYVQDQKNSKAHGLYINGAADMGHVKVFGGNYGSFEGLWEAADPKGTRGNASAAQDGINWYGVMVKNENGKYVYTYQEGTKYHQGSNNTRFDFEHPTTSIPVNP